MKNYNLSRITINTPKVKGNTFTKLGVFLGVLLLLFAIGILHSKMTTDKPKPTNRQFIP